MDEQHPQDSHNKLRHMDSLTDFVEQLNAEATAAVPPPTGFPTLGDFNDNSTGALKWKDLLVDMIYKVRSARSIHTHHGTTFILSLQTRRRVLLQCMGMLTKELLHSPSMLEDKQLRLFIRPTGPKTSKNGRVNHSYQLLQC